MSQHVYFKKYAASGKIIAKKVSPDLGIIIVLPCFNEAHIQDSIQSLLDCTPTKTKVELIVVVNSGATNFLSSLENNNAATNAINDCFLNNNTPHIQHHIIHAPLLTKKTAGVGMARKIGMDEAALRFMSTNNKRGVIACFDADSTCSPNYLVELENIFTNNPNINGCSIHFEHPLFLESNEPNNHIIDYEIHLRYYKNMLDYCNFPFPYHTIGSSMAVATEAYLKQGGMNKKKAGEDFYFLHRIFLLGNFTELKSATIYPSARISDRVPFGTGRAMMESISGEKTIDSYHPNGFKVLKHFYDSLDVLHQKNYDSWFNSQKEEMKAFLIEAKLTKQLRDIQMNKFSKKQFLNQIQTYFDGFKVLKFLHFYRDNYKKNISVMEAGNFVLNLNSLDIEGVNLNVLNTLRQIDKT